MLLIIQNSWNQLLQVSDWYEAVLLCDLNWQSASNRPKQTSREETTRAYGRGKRQPCPSGNTNHNWRFKPSVRQRTPPSLPPLQAQATIKKEDHLSRLEPSVRQCNPAVSWPPKSPSLPSSNHRHRNVNITLTPKRLKPFSSQCDPTRT